MNADPAVTKAEHDEKTGGLLYRGLTGDLVLTDRAVIIRRGRKGFATQLAVRGDKEIPYDSIVAIQFKKPGIQSGYIQLSLRGGSEAKAGFYQAMYDENTVAFRNTTRFAEARDLINARVDRAKATPPPQTGSDDPVAETEGASHPPRPGRRL